MGTLYIVARKKKSNNTKSGQKQHALLCFVCVLGLCRRGGRSEKRHNAAAAAPDCYHALNRDISKRTRNTKLKEKIKKKGEEKEEKAKTFSDSSKSVFAFNSR